MPSISTNTAPARDPGAFLPVGVKRKPDGTLNPSAKKFKPADPAAERAAAERAQAKADLEAKIATAKAQAEAMKREIRERAELNERRKVAAAKEVEARKELEKKEAALAKAERARAASNLLSGFANARKRTGVGTGPSIQVVDEPEALTQEERDRIAVRRVMMAGSDWAVLDVPVNAQAKSVKQAYRDLARRLHPDKCKAPGAKDAFQKLSKAYQSISANT
jgi:hypothetical protein